MKEVVIKQVEGGYIVVVGENGMQRVQVTPNLGRAVKVAKALFGPDAEEPATPVVESAKAA